MMEKKMAVVRDMVENGYHLMGWTVKEMAETFTLEELEDFRARFLAETR